MQATSVVVARMVRVVVHATRKRREAEAEQTTDRGDSFQNLRKKNHCQHPPLPHHRHRRLHFSSLLRTLHDTEQVRTLMRKDASPMNANLTIGCGFFCPYRCLCRLVASPLPTVFGCPPARSNRRSSPGVRATGPQRFPSAACACRLLQPRLHSATDGATSFVVMFKLTVSGGSLGNFKL